MSCISAIPFPFRAFAIFLHVCCSLYLMPSMMYDDVCISCFGWSLAGTGRQWMIQIWGWRQPKSATTCESTAKPSKSATKTYDSATRRHSHTHFEQPSQQKLVLTGPFWKASAGIAQMYANVVCLLHCFCVSPAREATHAAAVDLLLVCNVLKFKNVHVCFVLYCIETCRHKVRSIAINPQAAVTVCKQAWLDLTLCLAIHLCRADIPVQVAPALCSVLRRQKDSIFESSMLSCDAHFTLHKDN